MFFCIFLPTRSPLAPHSLLCLNWRSLFSLPTRLPPPRLNGSRLAVIERFNRQLDSNREDSHSLSSRPSRFSSWRTIFVCRSCRYCSSRCSICAASFRAGSQSRSKKEMRSIVRHLSALVAPLSPIHCKGATVARTVVFGGISLRTWHVSIRFIDALCEVRGFEALNL